MRTMLIALAAAVALSIAAVVWLPGSPPAVGIGWVLYMVLAVVVQPWGLPVLGALAALVAILWVLSRSRAG